MSTSSIPPPSGPPPLLITIRFTTSLPDLPLDIHQPSRTTVIALKGLVRAALPPSTASRRLRLIYSGRILHDASPLGSVLKTPSPPPRAIADPKGKGKGKGRAADPEPAARVYINCSIGDVLSADELAAEAAAATASTPLAALDTSGSSPPTGSGSGSGSGTSTTPAPRGFDRLLSTGFTPAEVGQLRLQFLSIHAANHTPESMPSPTTLRRMEDAWIDDNDAGTSGVVDAEAAGGALDDLLLGHLIGFLWPLGAVAWLSRQDGVWSERRQTAIWSGFMLCLGFGLMNVLS